jgi:hypothetical protein
MTTLELLEGLSYVVTIFGFPLAILIFLIEQRKERQNEEEEIYQRLSDEYADFLTLLLDNADLHLLKTFEESPPLTDEQRERKHILFNLLVSLFERAYILVFEEDMDRQAQRLWLSWEDYMREWCGRTDFRQMLPELLKGEDPEFATCIRNLASEEATRALKDSPKG